VIFRRKQDGEDEGAGMAYPGYPADPRAHVEEPGYPPGYGGYGQPAGPGQPTPTGPPAQVPPAARYEGDPDGAYVLYADVAPHLAELASLRGERRGLIELCLYARDRANSRAAADRIDSGLADLGVTTLRPDGQQFDPGQHEAAASVPTDDPARHGTVAETEVPGYADRGVVVRPPVVSVYRREGT
jgi:molecular chaperone GrpE